MELAFLIGRILYGGFFIVMGMNHFTKVSGMTAYAASKGVPFAGPAVVVTGLMIVLGGLGIITGMYVQLAVFLIVLFLFVVTLVMHNFWAISDEQEKMLQMVHFLKNLALLGAGLMALSIPTPWSYGIF